MTKDFCSLREYRRYSLAFCIFLSVKAGYRCHLLTHKVVPWEMQRRGYVVRLKKRQYFFHTLLFCNKADFRSANLTFEVIFSKEILRVATRTNACELTE